MITAALVYLVLVYVGAIAYALRPLPKAAAKQYVVRTTWTDKTHTTADYMDAWDWVKQYSNVDCRVWINDDMAQDFKPAITERMTDLWAYIKSVGLDNFFEPEATTTMPPADDAFLHNRVVRKHPIVVVAKAA